MEKYPSITFIRNLRLLSERTQAIVDNVFSLVLQVLFLKYKRKCREYEETLVIRRKKGRKRKFITGPLLLKEKDITGVISLVDFHIKTKREIEVKPNEDLSSLFGSLPLVDAVKYYDEFLVKGEIKDIMGRRIIFDEDGKSFLYKDHTQEGKHICALENYVEARGKRLPWVKLLLTSTREIYREAESYWETFLYVGIFKIRIDKDTIYEKEERNYFLVVIRKQSGKPMRFVTAYYMSSEFDLFKHLEKAHPLSIEQQEFIRLIEKKT